MEQNDKVKVALIATVIVVVVASMVLQAGKTRRAPARETEPEGARETPTELNAAPVHKEQQSRAPRTRKKKVAAKASQTNETTITGQSESHATQSRADDVASSPATAPANPADPSTA